MALAATGEPDLAELVNASTGREMKLAGVNWVFSPVCDINSDPRNPVIGMLSCSITWHPLNNPYIALGVRSFGDGEMPCYYTLTSVRLQRGHRTR